MLRHVLAKNQLFRQLSLKFLISGSGTGLQWVRIQRWGVEEPPTWEPDNMGDPGHLEGAQGHVQKSLLLSAIHIRVSSQTSFVTRLLI